MRPSDLIGFKEKGKSIADISGNVINPRVRIMFLIFVIILSWLVLAVFANASAHLFSPSSDPLIAGTIKDIGPQAVIPINAYVNE